MLDILLDGILDALIDTLKILPFLFLTYWVMEKVEHRMGQRSKDMIRRSGKIGPLVGALLGAVPQCGFSTAASNLYAGKIITMGTLVAIYLSTSDEMLPIMISESVPVWAIMAIIGIKVSIGLLFGFALDLAFPRNHSRNQKMRAYAGRANRDERFAIRDICENENCRCSDGIPLSATKHTIRIATFILLISVLLNCVIGLVGEESLGNLVLNVPIIGVLLSGIVGLIPNCAASVVITDLYLNGLMSFGAMMAGLLVGAGTGILVLCRVNESRRDNIRIIGILYLCGVVTGIVLELLGVAIVW